MRAALDGRLLVLFDGHCGLCNGAVRWLLKRDRRDRLRFAPLEGFAEIAARAGNADSMVVVVGLGRMEERVLSQSSGVLAALGELGWLWRGVARVLRLVPRPLRDWGYRLVARNRFRLKKRLEACPMPTEQEVGHFLRF